MKKIFSLLIALSVSSIVFSQNIFPPSGNAEIKSGNLLLETSVWRNSLLTLKDTHYSPDQIFHFQIESDGLKIRQDGNTNYQFKSGGNFIVNNGNVGIKTTNPTSTLEVRGGIRSSFDNNRSIITHTSGDGNSYINYAGGSPSSRIGFQIDGASKMSILNNGNVGIGTSSPLTKLHITTNEDALSWSMILNNARNNPTISDYGVGIKLKHSSNNEDYKWGGIASVQESSWANSSGLALYANETEYMRIKSNGNVGIGTTSPDEKLTVKGTIHTEEVRVDLNVPAPDYVFEKDYKLRSLKDTETYINKNKHLPEIPSAKQMEANGVELGDMNMLLLKKIEELTLYTIEQDKTLKEQQEFMEAQQKQLQLLQKEITQLKQAKN